MKMRSIWSVFAI